MHTGEEKRARGVAQKIIWKLEGRCRRKVRVLYNTCYVGVCVYQGVEPPHTTLHLALFFRAHVD